MIAYEKQIIFDKLARGVVAGLDDLSAGAASRAATALVGADGAVGAGAQP